MSIASHNYHAMSQRLRVKGRALKEQANDDVHKIAIKISREARRRAPKARSELTQSIQVHQLGQADYLVRSEKNYAWFVEHGSNRGGWPSLRAILDWIHIKGIEPVSQAVRNDRDLAFLISRSIFNKGTKAQPFLQPAADKFAPDLLVTIKRHIAADWNVT